MTPAQLWHESMLQTTTDFNCGYEAGQSAARKALEDASASEKRWRISAFVGWGLLVGTCAVIAGTGWRG